MKPLLEMPESFILASKSTDEQYRALERFWDALWINYVRNKGTTSLPYWLEQVGCPRLFNGTMILWKKYITSIVVPERSWAEVKLNEQTLISLFSEQELISFRKEYKMKQYLPNAKESTADNLVRVQGKTTKTGLIREGFMKAANSQYYFDAKALKRHQQKVTNNTNKSMRKLRDTMAIPMDDAAYDVISTDIVDYLANNQMIITQGTSFSDSRGRAIKESLRNVCNPIGYKTFRSLIAIPRD